MASNDNSSSKFSKYDRNRYRKIYPVNRHPKVDSYRSDKPLSIESVLVAFNDLSTASGELAGIYNSIPVMMVSPQVSNNISGQKLTDHQNQVNVNIFITSISRDASTGKITFTLGASSAFAGHAAVSVMSMS